MRQKPLDSTGKNLRVGPRKTGASVMFRSALMFPAPSHREQGKELALHLLSCGDYRNAVQQRFVRGRLHAISHDIHYGCTTGAAGAIGKRTVHQARMME